MPQQKYRMWITCPRCGPEHTETEVKGKQKVTPVVRAWFKAVQ